MARGLNQKATDIDRCLFRYFNDRPGLFRVVCSESSAAMTSANAKKEKTTRRKAHIAQLGDSYTFVAPEGMYGAVQVMRAEEEQVELESHGVDVAFEEI